ncbi:iron-sulfur cluster assembly protein [Actinophytocola algeriensis]|uniref:Metal-sulfur cluster biosynthetic enzyme n=1 Tax=Actinophytocola algeriensis TaxID=1768010 RepID=A0A7W7Q035_9PSEU|nr:iron-sulfur cluster assembly protein [Actinophytocola algeriensis]MBB4904507.1 metal-sulfur cluster biosynthetic enzyme [Actinophytocola algeriensis]MBE1476634.1 metal-sulfur cluster biosynthetic enzyme [Actinophytocola algeriensis]
MSALWDALGTVMDPELDQPVTELGFVSEAVVVDGHARVRLRLPTYFCAPNFAYLMVADAHEAVSALPSVTSVDVRLADHFAAEEINAGVAASAGFAGSFPGEAVAELDELRLVFQRKAYLASLDRLCVRLPGSPVGLTLADVPASPALVSLMRRRAALGLPCSSESPLLLDERGVPITAEEAPLRLRFARSVRVSIEGNAGFCRGLLHTRYPQAVGN